MLLLAILALAGMSYCEQEDHVTWSTLLNNNYIKLGDFKNGQPTAIEYLSDINPETELMVRMLFGNDDDYTLDPENDTRMNICDVLDKAVDDPNSRQALYNIPESLGLTNTRCPILKGKYVLAPYEFPTDFSSNDIGFGPTYYRIRVETANQGLETQAIMELHVDLTLTIANITYSDNSSSKLSLPSIISSLAIGFIVFQLEN